MGPPMGTSAEEPRVRIFRGIALKDWEWFDAHLQGCAGVERPNPTSLSVSAGSVTIPPVSHPKGQATQTLLLVIRLDRMWGV